MTAKGIKIRNELNDTVAPQYDEGSTDDEIVVGDYESDEDGRKKKRRRDEDEGDRDEDESESEDEDFVASESGSEVNEEYDEEYSSSSEEEEENGG